VKAGLAAALVLLSVAVAACRKGPPALPAGTYAVIETSMGAITVRLLTDKAPKTVAHFIGLATGKKQSCAMIRSMTA
jgi:hypothetical protein